MKTITKSLIGTIAAGAVAMGSVSPALAQGHDRDRDRDHGDHRGGISTGEVIAGALILGGIAAVAASSDNHRDGRYDRGRYGDRYDERYGNPRGAIERCVSAAENRASRVSWRGRADVTDIRSIRDTRYGYTVKGRIAVNTRGHDWRNNDPRYGRGWGNDYRGWNDNLRGYDAGNFTCKVSYDGRTSVSFSGIRGLR